IVVTVEETGKSIKTYTVKVTREMVSQATPTFSEDGAIAYGTQVTISSEDAEHIYYTTNGDNPTTSSTEYTGAITVNTDMTIKAIATRTGYINSAVGSASYTQAVSSNLTGMVLSGSPTNYTFSGGTYTYNSVSVANGVGSITVTPTGAGNITVDGTPVNSGEASGAITLSEGVERTIVVTVTESGKSVKSYTVKVKRDMATPVTPTPVTPTPVTPTPVIPSTPATPNVEVITVDVKAGATDDTVSKIEIERTTDSQGNKTDQVTYQAEKALETIEKLKKESKDIARIVIPDVNQEIAVTNVSIPTNTLAVLDEGDINLQIDTLRAKIDVPKDSLSTASNGIKDDLFFRIVPVKTDTEQEEIKNRAIFELGLANADNDVITVVGKPVTIETNMPSSKVDITLPLTGVTIPTKKVDREAFLKQLAIYIEHSDGDKEIVQGEIVTYADGVLGIRFHVSKFSIFTIVQSDTFNKSTACSIKKVTSPKNAKMSGLTITASVSNSTKDLKVAITTSAKSTWKLYSDIACKKELSSQKLNLKVGVNKLYIKVTAEDGKTSKVYTIKTTRKEVTRKVLVIATKNDFSDAFAGSVLVEQLGGKLVRIGYTKKDIDRMISYVKKNYAKGDRIYILGLSEAVDGNLKEELVKSGYNNVAVIGGKDKYETAQMIAGKLKVKEHSKVVLVNGYVEPEYAKSIQKKCASLGYAILFVKKETLTTYTEKALKDINPAQIYLVGDSSQISSKIETQIKKLLYLDKSDISRIDSGNDII
ncbi:MAG TPA: cadherin-like beta sandwich domain-containing protein, partial [Lachnospiraceae bacterium]|nr:cadherin-like beta sandwich domain-containing protein [Lachnospiraceae bacterium]